MIANPGEAQLAQRLAAKARSPQPHALITSSALAQLPASPGGASHAGSSLDDRVHMNMPAVGATGPVLYHVPGLQASRAGMCSTSPNTSCLRPCRRVPGWTRAAGARWVEIGSRAAAQMGAGTQRLMRRRRGGAGGMTRRTATTAAKTRPRRGGARGMTPPRRRTCPRRAGGGACLLPALQPATCGVAPSQSFHAARSRRPTSQWQARMPAKGC